MGFYGPITPVFDAKDQAILDERRARFDQVTGPRVGDWVTFNDGTERRISYIWREDAEPVSIQTSDGGSFYLGDGYVDMSGSLYSGVKPDTLTDTGQTRNGSCWFFHHNWMQAHNGVDVEIPFRVFSCSLPPTR